MTEAIWLDCALVRARQLANDIWPDISTIFYLNDEKRWEEWTIKANEKKNPGRDDWDA